MTIEDASFTFRRKEDEIAAEARLDGLYVIRTSLPKEAIGAGDAVSAYKSLSQVERAFRSLKTVDLEIRPIHHWLSDRVQRACVPVHAGLLRRMAYAPKAGADAL